MPDPLLITPDTRRRLQERYQEAIRLAGHEPADFARVHELLAECVRTDPGSMLYLEALLANLRQWGPLRRRSWLPDWLAGRQPGNQKVQSTEYQVLCTAPALLREHPNDAMVLQRLADAAGACDFEEVELRYWRAAAEIQPQNPGAQRGLARALTRQGRFDEALPFWRQMAGAADDGEAIQACRDMGGSDGRFEVAEQELLEKQFQSGGDLQVLAAREDLRLARALHHLEVARRRAASDPHPQAQALVGRMEQEHNRLEIDIFHLRSERHSDDLTLRLELARRLKRAGNYSGAIQRLEEARADPTLAAEVTLELGECWQHLRQFPKAIEFYRLAAIEAGGDHRTTLTTALYRLGVLAAAMDLPSEARDAFSRLLAIEPGYRDARERLDKLP